MAHCISQCALLLLYQTQGAVISTVDPSFQETQYYCCYLYYTSLELILRGPYYFAQFKVYGGCVQLDEPVSCAHTLATKEAKRDSI